VGYASRLQPFISISRQSLPQQTEGRKSSSVLPMEERPVRMFPFIKKLQFNLVNVGFDVLIAVVMKSTLCWDITPCSPLSAKRRFERTYRFHLQGRKISRARTQLESRWQANSPQIFLNKINKILFYIIYFTRKNYICIFCGH
jgi:hypothetical protein